MYERTSEEIKKDDAEWGDCRLLRTKEGKINVDNGNDNDKFEFNQEFLIDED